MGRLLLSALILLSLTAAPTLVAQDFPKPSEYKIAWELDLRVDNPKRIVVEVPGISAPQAYWYLTYTVTNNTDSEQMFLPVFELLAKDGRIIRSDKSIPVEVFKAIKAREGGEFLERFTQIAGPVRLGEDEARDGVAIWPEVTPEMGNFSIFVGGLSGEAVTLKDAEGNVMKDPEGLPIILRKTLQLNYLIRGDEVYPGEDQVNINPRVWVMR